MTLHSVLTASCLCVGLSSPAMRPSENIVHEMEATLDFASFSSVSGDEYNPGLFV